MISVWLTFELENDIKTKPPTPGSGETSIGVKDQNMKPGHKQLGKWVVTFGYSSALRKMDYLK